MHEVLLDCLVYAPVGAAIVVFEEVPRLAERGRERVDKQVAIARLLGRFAVREGQRRLRPPGSSSPRRTPPRLIRTPPRLIRKGRPQKAPQSRRRLFRRSPTPEVPRRS